MFAMFGATILVPLLTGMNVSVALVTAGLGTLLFHIITKGKVPVFLGSSFMFISCVAMYTLDKETNLPTQEGVQRLHFEIFPQIQPSGVGIVKQCVLVAFHQNFPVVDQISPFGQRQCFAYIVIGNQYADALVF